MPFIKYAHVCEYARVDSGGTVTIIGIFDTINAQTCPARFPVLHVITNLSGQKGDEFTFSTRLAGPDGKLIQAVQPVRIRVEQDQARINQINGYIGMVFPEFGEYSMEILINDMVVHTIPFQVLQRVVPQESNR